MKLLHDKIKYYTLITFQNYDKYKLDYILAIVNSNLKYVI
jgi:hypothetical protein